MCDCSAACIKKMSRAPGRIVKCVERAKAALLLAKGEGLTPKLIAVTELANVPERDLSVPEIELHWLYGKWLKRQGQDQVGVR